MEQDASPRPPASCEIEEISPDQAKLWLGKNHQNRRLSSPVVDHLKGIIARGEWMEDCTDGIGLDIDEGVVNGQHRLTAIAESDRTVRALVLRNVRPEVIKVIDQGRGRTFTQLLAMEGRYPHPQVVAPAIEWLYRMNNGFEQTMPTAVKPTIPQLLDLLAEHPKIVNSVEPAHEVYRRVQCPTKAMLCAYHYAMASVDPDEADKFFEDLASGVDLTERSPVYALRERYLKENGKDPSRKAKNYVLAAWLVKAWEATTEGLEWTEKQVYWVGSGRRGEPYPKVSDLPWDVVDSAIEPDDEDDYSLSFSFNEGTEME
jgi:hypothetical protein